MKHWLTLLFFCFETLALQLACQPTSTASNRESLQGHVDFPYQLRASRHYTMPKSLAEISGISFHPKKSNLVYAIQDEDGILFTYDLVQHKVVATFKFGKAGDYEDLATDGQHFYVLRSDGTLFSFPFRYEDQAAQVKMFQGLLPKAEYESLAIDSSTKKLYVLCKACAVDKKTRALTGYSLHMGANGALQKGGSFSIDMEAVNKLDVTVKKNIKPSAMTRRASANEWYILSSIDKLLLITDHTFRPKKIIRFARKDFEQPEGMAFDEHENLFICSEAGKKDAGKIYQFNKR